jgi:hypothetical protein
LRFAPPIAIEDDPRVAAAHAAPPTWDALADLAAARDAAAHDRFGRRAIDVLHRLHGAGDAALDEPLPPAVPGWTTPDGIFIDVVLAAAWAELEELADRHGVSGDAQIVRADGVRPRTFVVEPQRAVIIVVPDPLVAPADRFAVLHEFGHALAALISPAGIPRVLDEAVAALVARDLEHPEHPWHAATATAARMRRRALAAALDRCERALPTLDPPPRIAERPPWALWHDPGAQAAYVAAESLADRLAAQLATGSLATAIAAERAAIDRRDTGL